MAEMRSGPNVGLTRAQLRALRIAEDGGLQKVCGPHWMAYVDLRCDQPKRMVNSVTANRLCCLRLLSRVETLCGSTLYLTQAGADVITANHRAKRRMTSDERERIRFTAAAAGRLGLREPLERCDTTKLPAADDRPRGG
jgi:hypothetical protein